MMNDTGFYDPIIVSIRPKGYCQVCSVLVIIDAPFIAEELRLKSAESYTRRCELIFEAD